MVFFRLHESPRYLVHAGRHQEAVESLQLISKFNGSELSLHLEDVQDRVGTRTVPTADENNDDVRAPLIGASSVYEDTEANDTPQSVLPEGGPDDTGDKGSPLPHIGSSDVLRDATNVDMKDYSSMAESSTTLNFHKFSTPDIDVTVHQSPQILSDLHQSRPEESKYPKPRYPLPESPPRLRPSRRRDRSNTSSFYERKSWLYWHLPRWLRRPLWAWFDRIGMVLSPEWLRTTLLVWGAWWSMSLGMQYQVYTYLYICCL